jgi:hypothetical protein
MSHIRSQLQECVRYSIVRNPSVKSLGRQPIGILHGIHRSHCRRGR